MLHFDIINDFLTTKNNSLNTIYNTTNFKMFLTIKAVKLLIKSGLDTSKGHIALALTRKQGHVEIV